MTTAPTQHANATATDADRGEVDRRLRAAWHKGRRLVHLRGLCHLLLWAAALVLVAWAVDVLLSVPGWGRVLLLVIIVATLGWIAWYRWLRHLRRYDPVRTALEVERQHPELRSLLVSYVQLRDEDVARQAASPTLLNAMRRQALDAARPIDFKGIISYRQLRQVALVSLAMLIFFGAISVNWRDHFRVMAMRMLNPGSDAAYPTRTRLIDTTGDVIVRRGDPATLEFLAAGWIPAAGGKLWVRAEADGQRGEWESITLPPPGETADFPGPEGSEPGRRFTHRVDAVNSGFAYYLDMGDARTEARRVRVVAPPRLTRASLRLDLPEYTQRGTRTIDSLNVDAPAGSRITWQLRTDATITAAKLILEPTASDLPSPSTDVTPAMASRFSEAGGGTIPLDMTVTPDGTATATLDLAQPFLYRFTWTLSVGDRTFTFDDPVRYAVGITPDAPPTVELTAPTDRPDAKATLAKRVNLRFDATDDFGLATAEVVYTLNDDEIEHRLSLGGLQGERVSNAAAWPVQQTIPGLKEGDTLTWWVEVRDTLPEAMGGPQSSSSSRRSLQLVSQPEYLQYTHDWITRGVVTPTRGARDEEIEAARAVQDMKDELGLPVEPKEQP